MLFTFSHFFTVLCHLISLYAVRAGRYARTSTVPGNLLFPHFFAVFCHLFSLYAGWASRYARTFTGHANAQSLGRTLKLFFKFTSYFGCFLMRILYCSDPLVDFFNRNSVGTLLPILVRQH